ncbi:hypothetical protein CAI21_09785 [Alkalilimnicola ehrlichii]|uniref:Outer membrane protein beta-barrel domain-containing protein n=1 Tax=Alkalilimnicola ehrlichii TaxID=351052 RepID=A0A3E0WXZ6_9GAMM|nr:hypothetical protein [Alkalilimnicola ehrlichii]RFA29351.1 hypothetical protein CAI21_09785 [Alkalilimnicola ehrlichii]RFA36865.1 hypothetical protein CAL65_10120 [Alkalilimnicola ehrlichii]
MARDDDRVIWQGNAAAYFTLSPRINLDADAGRSVSTSGAGGFVETDRAKAGASFDIDERTRATMDIGWRDTRGATEGVERTFGAGVGRQLAPEWRTQLAFTHTQRKRGGESTANANTLALTLVYSSSNF